MEPDMAIQLACDVLKDHFGNNAERVGRVLLERGELPLQEILRFVTQNCTTGEDPLSYAEIRNALLVLYQHGLVTSRPHPQTIHVESLRALLQVYSIDVEEVLARLRFPHFLEHVYYRYGQRGYEILAAVLRYGRVAAGVIIAEARRQLPSLSVEDLQVGIRLLLAERLLHPVTPCDGAAAAATSVTAAAAQAAEGAADTEAKRPRLEGPAAANGGKAEQQIVPAQEASSVLAGNVYRYNRSTLNLCLCKNMLCRIVEERVNTHASQVLSALLTAVAPAETGGVTVDWMQFGLVEKRMNEMGAHQAGRDPAKEREKLRKVLDLLSAHKDGLVKKRDRVASQRYGSTAPDGAKGGARGRVATGLQAVELSPQAEQSAEWAVQWQDARRLLVSSVTSQLIRDQFGPMGLRIFNLLNERTPPQKMEDKDIFHICMVPQAEGREVLNEMARRHIVLWQEVPRSANTPLAASFWLFYVDPRRVEASILRNAMQAIYNLRIRFRLQSAQVAPLESRADSLTAKARAALLAGRRAEDILERSFLVLDSILLVFRCF